MTTPPGPFSPAAVEQICRVPGEAVTGSEIPNLIAPLKGRIRRRRHRQRPAGGVRRRLLAVLDAAVTFESVARAAGVSRSWLYTQPDIRDEVLRLRDLGRRAPGTSVPAHHRSSGASLLRRLQATTARNRELAEDNQRLRHQLAQALGQLRAVGIRPDVERHDNPGSRTFRVGGAGGSRPGSAATGHGS